MSDNSYLGNLKVDPGLKETWWGKYIVNIRYVLLLVFTILVVGISSYTSLPTRLNPEVKIPIVAVSTVLPGASPQDVEALLTKPLEKELAGLEGLDSMTSSSRDGVSSITLQFVSTVDAEKARQDAQNAVDTVNTLPEDALDPNVQKFDFENQPIWQFALYGKNISEPAVFNYANRLKDAIETSNKVKEVRLNGQETQEIQVVIKPEKVQELGINPSSLMQSVQSATGAFPAGSVHANGSTFTVAIDPQVVNVTDLRNLRVTTKGTVQRLGDIADVSERSIPEEARSYYADNGSKPTRVVTFSVYKTAASNIDEAEKSVKEILDREIEPVKDTFAIKTTLNTADEITHQFAELVHNFRDTIILVFIVLVAFLGFRQALIASFTIPMTFLAAFTFMRIFGLSINFLTLFSLLLALGLLIDDTVVAVQAMTSYDKTKRFTPAETGMLVWKDFIVPIWATTITTIWAFLPLLLATGIIGEFIKSIPIVVTVTLISSTAIAVLITIPLMIFVLKPSVPGRIKTMMKAIVIILIIVFAVGITPKNNLVEAVGFVVLILLGFVFTYLVLRTVSGEIALRFTNFFRSKPYLKKLTSFLNNGFKNGFINMEPVTKGFERIITHVITTKFWRRRILVIVILFAIFSYLLVPFGFVVNEFFPRSDTDVYYVNLELPAGTGLEKTDIETTKLMQQLRKYPEVLYVTGDIGQSFTENGGGASGSNTSQITVNLKDKTSIATSEKTRKDLATYQTGTVSVVEQSGGPPAGSDLQIKLSGEDLTTLDAYANKISSFLEKQDGVRNIQKSLKPGTSKLVFTPDFNKLAEAGISQGQIGQQLRTFASGSKLDSLTIGDEERDIVFRYSSDTETPAALTSIMITSPTGQTYPLNALGTFQLETNPTLITREDQKRTLSVSAGVGAGYSSVQINQKLEEFAKTELNLPEGYEWATGGVNEENTKSVQSIMQAMILAFILIFASMVLQFGSFRQAVLSLLVIPFAISGVFIIFALTATPLSFPALIGILALFGIVVTHSIMLLDKINLNLDSGMDFVKSIADAGASRLEPILLTSLLTIVGLIPITLSDPFWRGLGGAIIAGLFFTGAIKLFFIPVVYYMWFNKDHKKKA